MDSRVDAHQMNKFFVVLKEVFPSESPDWRGLVMLRCPSSGTNCALDSLSLWRPRRPQLRWIRLHGESSHENGLTFCLATHSQRKYESIFHFNSTFELVTCSSSKTQFRLEQTTLFSLQLSHMEDLKNP